MEHTDNYCQGHHNGSRITINVKVITIGAD